jgi:hypothetical protein
MSDASAPRARQRRARDHRGAWSRSAPDTPPACGGCGGTLRFSQPDEQRPDELMGSCDNSECLEWSVWTRFEGRWKTVDRISLAQRRNPAWTPARPATSTTAARA